MQNIGESFDYLQRFKEVSEIKSGYTFGPKELIAKWEKLIIEISEGYNWEPEELENDIESSRGIIQDIYSEDSLDDYSEHKIFKKIISHLDKKFKALTIEHSLKSSLQKSRWWTNRILKNGGEKYRAELSKDALALIS